MPTCPTCGGGFEPQIQFCPRDGTALVAAAGSDPLVGRVIGERYRLEARLGRGAMGTVYRAVHTRMEKPVAVKLLRPELAGDSDAVARFHREARSASRLDHEHCIRVTDFGQTGDGLLYLVMELLDGESLSGCLSRGALRPRLAAAIAHDIALALQHAHEHGVIHRDLKPDNVMIARRGRRTTAPPVVKVLDFGLAKIAGEAAGPTLTRTGAVFGTPEYMAPEQAQGLAPDARADLYALGVLLYQMVTGGLPFRAPNYLALLAMQVEAPPEPPRRRRPDLAIPSPLEDLILRCLEKSPGARPPTAEAIAAALAPLADHALIAALAHPSEGDPAARATTLAPAAAGAPPDADAADSTRTPTGASPGSGGTPRMDASPTGGTAVGGESPPEYAGQAAASGGEAIARWEGGDDEQLVPSPPGDDAPDRGDLGDRDLAAGDDADDDLVPPRRRWRLPAVLALAGVVAAGLALTTAIGRRTPRPPAPAPARVDPLEEARRLLDTGELEAARRILVAERAAHDGVGLQLLLGELDLRRGNRLGALAHLHHAVQLAPSDAEPHARLASHLHVLDQTEAACREARAALALDPKNPTALAADEPCRRPR